MKLPDIEYGLKQLPQENVPVGLHDKIMRACRRTQLQRQAWPIAVMVLVNLCVSVWHTESSAQELGSGIILKEIFINFEFSRDFLVQSAQAAYDFLPLSSLVSLALNLAVAAWFIGQFGLFRQRSLR